MSRDVASLERRIAMLEKRLRALEAASLPSEGGSSINMVTSEDATPKITLGHDDLTTYPNAVGYMNAARTDIITGLNTGVFDFGAYWDSTHYSFIAFGSTGYAVIFLRDGATFRYVAEFELNIVRFNAPVKPPTYTTTQRNALTGLEAGVMIWNTTDGRFQGWNGSTWVNLS